MMPEAVMPEWVPCPVCALAGKIHRAYQLHAGDQNQRYSCSHCPARFGLDKRTTALATAFHGMEREAAATA